MEKETAQALWQRLEDAYRAQEKRWSRLSLAFGLSKLVLLVTFFLTVYFIGRAGASAWSGALAAAQAVLFAAACVVRSCTTCALCAARPLVSSSAATTRPPRPESYADNVNANATRCAARPPGCSI